MFDSIKLYAEEKFANMTKEVRDTVIKRSASLVNLIEKRAGLGAINSTDQEESKLFKDEDECDSSTKKTVIQLEDIKFNQLLNMSRTFNQTIAYFSPIFPKCSSVPLKTRCTKLVVS